MSFYRLEKRRLLDLLGTYVSIIHGGVIDRLQPIVAGT